MVFRLQLLQTVLGYRHARLERDWPGWWNVGFCFWSEVGHAIREGDTWCHLNGCLRAVIADPHSLVGVVAGGGGTHPPRGRFGDSSRSNRFEREVQWRVDEREEALAAEGRRAVVSASGLVVELPPPSS